MATNLGLPSMNTLSTMLDSVELVKKAWSSLNLPTQFAPTMDVEELDKRVADLKAVEQWLNVNLSMLRGTIQGLEIQRGTLAAVQAFGKAMTPSTESQQMVQDRSASVSNSPKPTPSPAMASMPLPAPAADAAAPTMANPTSWWNLLQDQFNQVAQAALAGSALANSAMPSRKSTVQFKSKATDALKARSHKAPAPRKPAARPKRGGPANTKLR